MNNDVALSHEKAVAAAATANARPARTSARLQELIELVRATYLFVQNYRNAAPSVTNDPHAVEWAALKWEEYAIKCLRETIEEEHPASAREKERIIGREIARLANGSWASRPTQNQGNNRRDACLPAAI